MASLVFPARKFTPHVNIVPAGKLPETNQYLKPAPVNFACGKSDFVFVGFAGTAAKTL